MWALAVADRPQRMLGMLWVLRICGLRNAEGARPPRGNTRGGIAAAVDRVYSCMVFMHAPWVTPTQKRDFWTAELWPQKTRSPAPQSAVMCAACAWSKGRLSGPCRHKMSRGGEHRLVLQGDRNVRVVSGRRTGQHRATTGGCGILRKDDMHACIKAGQVKGGATSAAIAPCMRRARRQCAYREQHKTASGITRGATAGSR